MITNLHLLLPRKHRPFRYFVWPQRLLAILEPEFHLEECRLALTICNEDLTFMKMATGITAHTMYILPRRSVLSAVVREILFTVTRENRATGRLTATK